MPPNKQGRAIAVSQKNSHLAISNNLGKISIRTLEDFDKKVCSMKDPK